MNEISPDQLLGQIRSLARNLEPPTPTIAGKPESPDFSQMLERSLNTVSEMQQQASDLMVAFGNDSSDASLAEVMIAAQKADLSFRAVTEVRNKLVQAYQDIMNMPV